MNPCAGNSVLAIVPRRVISLHPVLTTRVLQQCVDSTSASYRLFVHHCRQGFPAVVVGFCIAQGCFWFYHHHCSKEKS